MKRPRGCFFVMEKLPIIRIPQPAFRCFACNHLNYYSQADLCVKCGRASKEREKMVEDRIKQFNFGEGLTGLMLYIQALNREYYYKFT